MEVGTLKGYDKVAFGIDKRLEIFDKLLETLHASLIQGRTSNSEFILDVILKSIQINENSHEFVIKFFNCLFFVGEQLKKDLTKDKMERLARIVEKLRG